MRPAQSTLAPRSGRCCLPFVGLSSRSREVFWNGNEWLLYAQNSLSLVSRFFRERRGALKRVAELSIEIEDQRVC